MSSTFRAQDLKSSIADSTRSADRSMWSVGSIRHVIKALNGQPVAVELDRQTGWTLVGAVLTEAYDNRLGVCTEASKTTQNPMGLTRYFLPKVGVIIGLGDSSKYTAITFERTEHELARKLFLAEFTDLPQGEMDIRSTARGVVVSHNPTKFSEGKYQWGDYSLAQLQEASPCEHCLTLAPEYENLHEKSCPVYVRNAEARRGE
jgi:thiol-disulfide isomerase/thioredoxin